jgi:diguanylate cyclase (GGDEF)-like protein
LNAGHAGAPLIPRPASPRSRSFPTAPHLEVHAQDVHVRHEHDIAAGAHRDPLTGLANRLRFLERLRHEIARSERSGLVAAVIVAGLGELDEPPGTGGHGARDEMLMDVGRRWATSLRAGDVLACIGGDRFAVICADLPSKQQAMTVADRLRAAAAEAATAVHDRQSITLSIGVAFASRDDEEDPAEALLRRADEARYHGGRGTLRPRARHAVTP